MRIKPYICFILGLVSLLGTFLFVGIKHDPEFSWEIETFIKYKPTFQIHFYDESYGDLHNEETAKQTERYNDFVYKHSIWNFSFLLIQITMTLIIIGVAGSWKKKFVSWRSILIHFVICAIPTTTCLVVYLFSYNEWWVWLFLLGGFLINLYTALKLTKRSA